MVQIKKNVLRMLRKNKRLLEFALSIWDLRKLKHNLKYCILRVFPCKGTDKNSNFVLSTTTTKNRLNKIDVMLESIMRQKTKPKRIILWLSDEIKNEEIPKKVLKYKKRGLEIRFCKDMGPHTKSIYTLEEFQKKNVVVSADTDMVYSKDFLTIFMKAHKKYPKDILCFRASIMNKENDKKLTNYLDWREDWENIKDPKKYAGPNIFPKSDGGMLYPINSLPPETFNRIFRKISRKNDDIWIKAMALLKDTNCRKIRKMPQYVEETYGMGRTALWNTNIHRNDKILKTVFDHYKLYKKIEKI